MSEREHKRVVKYLTETPWAIWPSALVTIGEIVRLRIDGVTLSQEELDERIKAVRGDRQVTPSRGAVAVIPVHGPLVPHADMMTEVSGLTSYDSLRASFREAMADQSVQTIVLDIDSPGGSVDLLSETAAEIRRGRKTKEIVAVANAFSASAAYYLQSAASQAVVTPSGMVGSVGTIAFHQSLSAALEMEGVDTSIFIAEDSPFKSEQNPFEPLSEEGAAQIQAMVDHYGREFIRDVAIGRGISESKVRNEFGQGRMLTADQALAVGMVDRVASLDEVLSERLGPSRNSRRTRAEQEATVPAAAADGSPAVTDDREEAPAGVVVQVETVLEGSVVARGVTGRIENGTNGDGHWDLDVSSFGAPGKALPAIIDVIDEAAKQEFTSAHPSAATSRGAHDNRKEGDAMETTDAPRTREGMVARMEEISARQTELDEQYTGRLMQGDDEAEFDQLEQEYHDLEQTVKQMDERARRIERKAAATGTVVGNDNGAAPPAFRTNVDTKSRLPENLFDLPAYRQHAGSIEDLADLWGEASRRVVEGLTFDTDDQDRPKNHLDRLLKAEQAASKPIIEPSESLAHRILLTADPAYDRAFGKMVMNRPLTTIEQARVSAAISHTGLGSETPVPVTIDPTVLLTSDGQVNPLRQLARNVSITGNKWRPISSDGVSVTYEAELSQVADQTPSFDTPEFTVQKAHGYVEFSIEVDQDWPELRSNLAVMFQDAKDAKEAEKFLYGTGTNEPAGLLAADPVGLINSTSEIDTITGATFAIEDLYALKGALPARWRARAAWLANDMVFSAVRGFGDASANTFWVDMNDDRPPRLLGKPVYEASEMPDDFDTEDVSFLVYGDFSRGFVIVDRIGMNVELIPHVLGANRRPIGARALYVYFRNTSGLITKKAFRLLRTKST